MQVKRKSHRLALSCNNKKNSITAKLWKNSVFRPNAQDFAQNTFRNFPNFLPTVLCSSVLPLCLHYTPRLETSLTIILEYLISECSIRVFHYKVNVLLEIISLRSYLQYI